jgi:hypothetical protein
MSQACQIELQKFQTDYLESQVSKSIATSAKKGREAMEFVIAKLETDCKELQRVAEVSLCDFAADGSIQFKSLILPL